jgi:hypothetical protein
MVGKPEGKRPLGRPKHRWEDNLRDRELESVDWIHVAQDRDRWHVLVGTVMKHQGSITLVIF